MAGVTSIIVSPITSYYASLDGIVRPTPTTLTIWVKSEYKPGNNLLALGIVSALTHDTIDCARKQIKFLTTRQRMLGQTVCSELAVLTDIDAAAA